MIKSSIQITLDKFESLPSFGRGSHSKSQLESSSSEVQQTLSHALLVPSVIYPVILRCPRVQNVIPLKNGKSYKP